MPDKDLKFIASYDGQSLDAGLKKLQSGLEATAKDADGLDKALGKTGGANSATAALAKTALAANKLDSSLPKVKVGAAQAGQSLINLGRIAQDAPFGFIGIQNNIDPLLQSFRALKAETGSTGAALKALGSSLLGAGGLGLAVSVVTSSITVFSLANRGASEDVKKAKEKVDEAAEAQKRFEQAVSSASQAVISQAKEIKDIRTILVDTSAAYDILTDATKRQALAQFLFAQRSDDVKRILDGVVKSQLQVVKNNNPFAAAGVREYSDDLFAVDRYLKDVKNGTVAFSKATLATKKALQETAKAGADLANTNALSKGLDALFASIVDGSTKTKGAKETISDVLAELAREIDFLNKKEIAFNTNETKAKLSAYFSTVEKLIKDFNVDPQSTLVNKLFGEAADIKIKNFLAIFREAAIKAPIEIPITFAPLQGESIFAGSPQTIASTLGLNDLDDAAKVAFLKSQGITTAIQDGLEVGVSALRFPQLKRLYDSVAGRLLEFNARTSQLIQGTLIDTFSGIGETLGNILSGQSIGDAFGSLFGSLLESLGQGIKEFGVQALLATKIILAVKATLGKTPGIGVAIGAIALGAIIQNLGKRLKTPQFALGGTTPGGVISVGERGRELIQVPQGSRVIPNAQSNAILSGGGGIIIPEVRVSGQDLVLVFNRAQRTNGRNG